MNAKGLVSFIGYWLVDSFSENLADQVLFAIGFHPDVFPVKTVGRDVREDPIGVFLGEHLSDKPVPLLGEAEPFHGVVAGVNDVVTMLDLVEHP